MFPFTCISPTKESSCTTTTDAIYCFQLEKAKKKEAAFIVTFAKKEQEIADLKVTLFLLYSML